MQARIISHHGRQAWVMDTTGTRHLCVYKGRDLLPAANDLVELDLDASPAVITAIHPRENQLIRSESHRTKTLAANVDQALIVLSGAPIFSDEILARIICACAAERIGGVIAVNKIDLPTEADAARVQLACFMPALKLLGWSVVEVCAKPGQAAGLDGVAGLRTLLAGKITVILGQSGMGKSSLLNVLVPGINAQTREISEALQTGKHTTTASTMVRLESTNVNAPTNAVTTVAGAHDGVDTGGVTDASDAQRSAADHISCGWLIDTPGFQLYGLHHLSESEMALGFPEWQAAQEAHGRCKYFNCHHAGEPGCTVQSLVAKKELPQRRLELWRMLTKT
jgi:ribosome biogenesis GTPase / thiamine phosphate phosphatase